LFGAAIAYAEQGFPVTEAIDESWNQAENLKKIRACPESVRVFLPGGGPPQVGGLFRNPDLARTFRAIAEHGRDGFYRGKIAAAILETSQRLGGTMTA